MMCNLPIPLHVQIYNTYGENLTNAQLLVRYGFALPSGSNDNDMVSWKIHELPTAESPALRTPQGKSKSVESNERRREGEQQSSKEPWRRARSSENLEDLRPALKKQFEDLLRIWPVEARWKESELVFNPPYPYASEVSVLPLSESAVDEGGQAAGEANPDVVLVEPEDVDDITIESKMTAASGSDSTREDFLESTMIEGYRYQYRPCPDAYDPNHTSGNDAISASYVSAPILRAQRAADKEEGTGRHLHLGSTKPRALHGTTNGNRAEDEDSHSRNEGNIGNSGIENSGNGGRSGNTIDIGNTAHISINDGFTESRGCDSNGDEEDEEDIGRSRIRREQKRMYEGDSDGSGNDGRRKKRRRIPVKPILCINGDAKISHHLWVYCALCSLAIVRGTQRAHSHVQRTREDHKHGDSFGPPLGHSIDAGSEAPKAELKTSDPIYSTKALLGSPGGLGTLDELGRVGLGKTDEVLRVLSAVAGRQISLERSQQQQHEHKQHQGQQEGEMEVEEDLDLELDAGVDTGMGEGETLGGDTRGEERLQQEEEGPLVSVRSDSEEGWGEEGDEDEDEEEGAGGTAGEGQYEHQGSRQGDRGGLGILDSVKSENTHNHVYAVEVEPTIVTRNTRNSSSTASNRSQSKLLVPIEEGENESEDTTETLEEEEEVSKVLRHLVRTITSLCTERIQGTTQSDLRAQMCSMGLLPSATLTDTPDSQEEIVSVEEMGELLDKLGESPRAWQKTRWAIEQVLCERAILDSCRYAWLDLPVGEACAHVC